MGNCGCKGPCNCGSCNPSKSLNSGCCGSSSTPQCCSPTLPCAPTPFFAQVPTCQENNVQNVIYEQFRAELTVANSWNIPDCGGSAILSVSGLRGLLIGSYLWNGAYGYFQVIGFNAATNQITIQNNCNDGNAEVGTQVPACSEFVVVDPPSTSGGTTPTLFPYVAIDFTAPAVSTCLDITVTTVNGLAVGKNVQIGSGIYRLNSIPSSTIINICNDGSGITPGTSVIAQNSQGQFQYPVVLIDTNACTNSAASTGILLVCNGGISVPLAGDTLGSVPVLVNAITGAVEFQPLEVPTRTCTTLTACLVLTPGQLEYTLVVADSTQFEIGDILQIGTRTDRFVITDIPDATHIIALCNTDPSTIQTIDPGTSVCIVDCCEIIESVSIPCSPKANIGEIEVVIYVLAPEFDIHGYYEVELTGLPGKSVLASVVLPAPPSRCAGVGYACTGHTSVAVVPDYTTDIDGFASMYQEVEIVWNTNPFNASRTSGKMVWFSNYPTDDKGDSGFPPDATSATFDQLTTIAGTIAYHQNDIDALAILTAPSSDTLIAWYKLLLGDNFTPASVDSVSVMISGWLEIMVVS